MLIKKLFEWIETILYRFRKTDVALIEDEDLIRLLKKSGLMDSLLTGTLQCSKCGKTLMLENISAFIVTNGKYQFICDDKSCISWTHNP